MSIRKFLFNRITANVFAGIVLIFALVLGTRVMLDKVTRHNHEITVPDLTNMSLDEAAKVVSANRMKLEVIDSVYVRRMGKGLIYRQNPKAGSKVKEGRRILLTINAVNAKKVMMPNLIGYSMRQAKAEILSKGLQIGRLEYVSDIATNNVLKQLHDGAEIAPGTMIESESRIDLETVTDYSDSLNAVVYRLDPDYGETPLLMGMDISLYLTTDISKVPVPEEEEETEENTEIR